MAIYINPYLGSESRIFELLLIICRCDPGLSSIPDVYGLELQFTPQGAPSFSSGRLQEIATSPKVVSIHGVDDSFILPWGQPMLNYAGVTDVDRTMSTEECSVWVDITEAGGMGYRALDSNGNYIYAPMATILFHELAHVYHAMIVEDTPVDKTPDQLLAIADENQFRAQLGLPTRNPNVTMHSHIGPPAVGPTALKGCNEAMFPDLCKCNIATVALGSPIARQIVEFRRAKTDLEVLTFGGAPLLAPMLNAYQVFSPLVAGRMLADPSLRDLMLRFGVQPALHLLRVVRSYIATSAADTDFVVDVQRIIDDCLNATAASDEDLLVAAAAASLSAGMLREGSTVTPTKWCSGPADVFAVVASQIQTSGADGRGAAWVLDGIAWVLRLCVQKPGAIEDFGSTGRFCRWLADIPLPPVETTVCAAELIGELTQLTDRVFRHHETRLAFANRILAALPNPSALWRGALEASGYLARGTTVGQAV